MRPGLGDGRNYGWSAGTKEGSTVKQWRFEVSNRSGFVDARGQAVLEDIKELGISAVEAVSTARVYLIEADFDKVFARRVAVELLTDMVCHDNRGTPKKRRDRSGG